MARRVIFKRSCWDEKGNEIIASYLSPPLQLIETYALHRLDEAVLKEVGVVFCYSATGGEFANDILSIHKLRLYKVPREDCGFFCIYHDNIRLTDSPFLYGIMHHPATSVDMTANIGSVRKFLKRMAESLSSRE